MMPTRRVLALAALLSMSAVLGACAPMASPAAGGHGPAPHATACEAPVYLRLRDAEPDSLSEREWARLQQLEELCILERRATAEATLPEQAPAQHGGGPRGAGWLWMPAMMLLGSFGWLMMGR